MSDRLLNEGVPKRVAIAAIVLFGLLLIAGIVAITGFVIGSFREKELIDGQHELENTVLLLSRHFEQQFEDFADAQARLTARLATSEIGSPSEFADRMSTFAVHSLLEAEGDGSFGVNDVGLYGADGDLINTSESGPIATVSIDDQPYFKSFKSNATSATTRRRLRRGQRPRWRERRRWWRWR